MIFAFTNIEFLFINLDYASDDYNDNESEFDNGSEQQALRIGKQFDSWDEVDKFFDEYALSKGFAVRKCRGDHITLEDGSQRLAS